MEKKEKAVRVLNHAGHPRGVAERLNEKEIGDLAAIFDKAAVKDVLACIPTGVFSPIWEAHLERLADSKAVVDEEPIAVTDEEPIEP